MLLADPAEQVRRRAMLALPHMAPLAAYAEALRACPGCTMPPPYVPDFDPLDGGTEAEALFLLEKPGPRGQTGFVSRDNPTGTAAAIRAFMAEAGLPRERTALWNAVPWWNGMVAVREAERQAGADSLARLLPLLPRVRAVVLVGRTAGRLRPVVEGAGLAAYASAHPSPQVRAGWPTRWAAIAGEWGAVRQVLDGGAVQAP